MKHGQPIFRHTLLALAGLLSLTAGVALLLGWVSIDRPLPPLLSAIQVEATVTAKRIHVAEETLGRFSSERAHDRYFIEVTFLLPTGATQRNELQVEKPQFDAHPPGSQVAVWYFPDRPNINGLGSPLALADKGSRYGQLLGWLLVVVGAFGSAIYGNKWHVARGGQSIL